MDGAQFISKVVNDIATNPAQAQNNQEAAPQGEHAQVQQDGAAHLINGLSVDQVKEIYHSVVQARAERAASPEEDRERAATINTITAAYNAEIDGSAQVDRAVADFFQTTFADLTPLPGVTQGSALAMFATGAVPAAHEEGGYSVFLSLPSDTLFGNQWHLNQTTGGLFDLGDLSTIWDEYTGAGVEVAVIDDAVQRTHHQLDDNYSYSKDWDFENNDTNPSGVDGDNHGTAVAGIIGAARDGVGTVGVAYDATIFGMSIGPFVNDHFIDTMIAAISSVGGYTSGAGYRAGHQGDIANMSLGTNYGYNPAFGMNFFDLALDTTKMSQLNTAINAAATNGRGGLGTIMVKSAGNERTASSETGNVGHDANASSWNANIHTISVAAVNQNGFVSSYSSPGANILISGFGSPLSGQVWTTDRLGSEGYNGTDYTGGFNGTSAAAPMVSGVIALMLEANSGLGWRDVQEILAYSARHVGSAVDGSTTAGSEKYAWDFNGANNWNGGGLHFSNDYGFGLIDAFAAVRMAEVWTTGTVAQTSANDSTDFEDLVAFSSPLTLTGNNTADVLTWTAVNDVDIEHVRVSISFSEWDDLGDLDIVIIAPDGTEVHLINNVGENDGTSAGGFTGRWDFTTPGFMGMQAAGTWTLELRDQDSATVSPITITDLDVRIIGAGANDDETFIFTNEFSDFSGGSSHSTSSFSGGSTGVDTINAVAVTSNTTVNLGTNSGNIDGVAITGVSHIERVFTGDGNDTIIGDAFSTHLYGGRGNDTISIASGVQSQSIYGGAGNDILSGGGGVDRLYGGAGNDTFRFSNGADMQTGDFLDGSSGYDKIQLSGAGDYNFTADFEAQFIEEIEFLGDGSGISKTLRLGSDELNDPGELGAVLIDGNAAGGSDDNIIISTGAENVVDISGWTFQDWTSIDTITINGNSSANTLTGSSEADTINGGNGTDTLYGGDGNDILNGGGGGTGGPDQLYGGNGDDTFIYINAGGFDDMYGGAGSDTADFSGASSGLTFDFNADVHYLAIGLQFDLQGIQTVIGSTGNNTFIDSNSGAAITIDGGAGVDTLDLSSRAGTDANNIRTLDIDQGYSFSGGAFQGSWSNLENLIGFVDLAQTIIGNGANNRLTGGDRNDTINSEAGNDTVYGGAGDDIINTGSGTNAAYGGVGDDTITSSGYGSYFGGDGDDTINAGNGSPETLDGGNGVDTLDTTAWNGNYTIDMTTGVTSYVGESFINFENLILGNGTNSVTGTTGNNEIFGGSGSDTIDSVGGVNLVYGLGGDDTITSSGFGTYIGGGGNDTINAGAGGAETLNGGNGNDTLDTTTWGGNYTIDMTTGVTNYTGESFINFENIITGSGNDDITGTSGANSITTNAGNDTVDGGAGDDFIYGGAGLDYLVGGNGSDEVFGGAGEDSLFGGNGDDRLDAGDDDDFIASWNGSDTLWGRAGDDHLRGQAGEDSLVGGEGRDRLEGGGEADLLLGGNGADKLFGGNGRDVLNGGVGNDLLNGGVGSDTFVFTGSFGDDRIQGFNATDNAEDIDLSGVASITGWGDLSNPANGHMYVVGSDVMIDDLAGNTIRLVGVNIGDLDANDFLF